MVPEFSHYKRIRLILIFFIEISFFKKSDRWRIVAEFSHYERVYFQKLSNKIEISFFGYYKRKKNIFLLLFKAWYN